MSCTIPKSYKGEIRVHAIPAPLLRARVCDGSPHAGPAGSTAVPGLGASCFFFVSFFCGKIICGRCTCRWSLSPDTGQLAAVPGFFCAAVLSLSRWLTGFSDVLWLATTGTAEGGIRVQPKVPFCSIEEGRAALRIFLST